MMLFASMIVTSLVTLGIFIVVVNIILFIKWIMEGRP